jgi:hypothetical protein
MKAEKIKVMKIKKTNLKFNIMSRFKGAQYDPTTSLLLSSKFNWGSQNLNGRFTYSFKKEKKRKVFSNVKIPITI